jgi:hypothetical protein
MPFRGYFALNGVEISNSSRVVAHLTKDVPTDDSVFGLAAGGDCSQTPNPDDPGLGLLPPSEVDLGNGLGTVANGTRLYDPGLGIVGDCWQPSAFCGCRDQIQYDDSWPGLQDYIGDSPYRVELAPWYNSRLPQSGEFGGIWVMDAKGFGPLTVNRAVTENIGSGASAGPNRDTSRKLTFDALLLACTNAGLEYGLQWLACELRSTIGRADSVLMYFTAHPQDTAANANTLVRELHGVVMTGSPTITAQSQAGKKPWRQADLYRVSWELTVLNPYVFLPVIDLGTVSWKTIAVEPITWAHAPMCATPPSCDPMPVLFSDTCPPETINVGTNTPPPVCGGCLPVCAIDRYTYAIPSLSEYPAQCSDTAATVTITNNSTTESLTVQGYWKLCNVAEACDDDQYPVQINGLPAQSSITLDAVSGQFWATVGDHQYVAMGIVSTPNGAPWVPPIIDRTMCWEFVIVAPEAVNFSVDIALADREA